MAPAYPNGASQPAGSAASGSAAAPASGAVPASGAAAPAQGAPEIGPSTVPADQMVPPARFGYPSLPGLLHWH
jgi:phospholipid-binding lipoprotein MlaA